MAYEYDTGKTRISALIGISTRDEINKIADKDKRSFSNQVDILIQEALEARNKAKQRRNDPTK